MFIHFFGFMTSLQNRVLQNDWLKHSCTVDQVTMWGVTALRPIFRNTRSVISRPSYLCRIMTTNSDDVSTIDWMRFQLFENHQKTKFVNKSPRYRQKTTTFAWLYLCTTNTGSNLSSFDPQATDAIILYFNAFHTKSNNSSEWSWMFLKKTKLTNCALIL